MKLLGLLERTPCSLAAVPITHICTDDIASYDLSIDWRCERDDNSQVRN
jgi:hypothetical protein